MASLEKKSDTCDIQKLIFFIRPGKLLHCKSLRQSDMFSTLLYSLQLLAIVKAMLNTPTNVIYKQVKKERSQICPLWNTRCDTNWNRSDFFKF